MKINNEKNNKMKKEIMKINNEIMIIIRK